MRIGDSREDLNELAILSGHRQTHRIGRSCEESRREAADITVGIGPRVPIIDKYLDALSFAPAQHLRMLKARGACIVFAPTIDAALTSAWAAQRRGRSLTLDETRDLRVRYGPESGTLAIYDPVLDALVFPTSYCCRDIGGVAMHELGHALTIKRAVPRQALLDGLPTRLRRHVMSDEYLGANEAHTLRLRCLEALAEAYVCLVEGRLETLPQALASELIFMLQTVDEGRTVRFEFEDTPDGERTASRASSRDIIDGDDPAFADLFAPVRCENDEPWRMANDELAARRRRRTA